ncbi:MAG: hypothetical protein RI932_2357 [Pseudomonadota bacterium]|jgi:hypothetical protein
MEKLIFRSSKQVKSVWDATETRKISALMNLKYKTLLDDEQFQVESGFNEQQVQIKVTLERNDKSVFYPIELIHVIENQDEQSAPGIEEIASLMLDYIDVYWQEYLHEGRDVFVPLAWSKHACEGVEFFVRGFIRNRTLEEQADELFRKHGHGDHEIEPISEDL